MYLIDNDHKLPMIYIIVITMPKTHKKKYRNFSKMPIFEDDLSYLVAAFVSLILEELLEEELGKKSIIGRG